jgi:hypothetical protein
LNKKEISLQRKHAISCMLGIEATGFTFGSALPLRPQAESLNGVAPFYGLQHRAQPTIHIDRRPRHIRSEVGRQKAGHIDKFLAGIFATIEQAYSVVQFEPMGVNGQRPAMLSMWINRPDAQPAVLQLAPSCAWRWAWAQRIGDLLFGKS